MSQAKVPAWVNVALIPVLNILLAFLVSGLVILAIGENPIEAAGYLIYGAFGYDEGMGYTLYYATNLIFTGLAVSVAFKGGLFNIGGEGQAYIGGLGVGLICLSLDHTMPFYVIAPLAVIGAAVFGAAWGYIPAYLQARRGSHIVITTIMFNFIASSLMVYLIVNWLKQDGRMAPNSRTFEENAWLPYLHEVFSPLGIEIGDSPLNLSFIWALLCCVFVWGLVWHTRWGYQLRTLGTNPTAARYAGIDTAKVTIWAMLISGGLAGFVGLNEIMGVNHNLLLNFTAGYGFAGIAVALMGRNNPIGIILAAILFGALYQGGAELAFEIPTITPEIVVVIQGLVILFSGALEHMFKDRIEGFFIRRAVA
ncbi:ABC transporter permease [Marinomonas foliarum]|jgi:general nucleoside transport system permease protein|uniref:ABC transporter permease n=1 Tax=Marinomonas foliarum TaxID=491950 RepID=A0A368ZS52_9GAMM|nr:ABC transporter permease [Marinomonas foliarum]QRV22694.1 ABC transporter permease [Marinomonas foliarum]RCW97278.1 nucleoside ABC transporter membrane protein [Marinomonas foliarum]